MSRVVVVDGGTNDHDGPDLTIVTPIPTTITRGESFTLELRATDQSPPLRAISPLYVRQGGPFVDNDVVACAPPLISAVSAGVVDIAIMCTMPADTNPGDYWGGYSVIDDFGNASGSYGFVRVI